MSVTISAFMGDMDQDIHLDDRGDLAIASRVEDVRQRVLEALRFNEGEWYLDRTAGVAYLRDVFIRPVEVAMVSNILTDAIRAVDGVAGVSAVEVDLDTDERRMTYKATIRTDAGDTTVGVSI